MPIDFPDNPTIGQIYTSSNNRSWEWDGTRWISATQTNIESYITSGVANIVDSAPSTLDTLNELAAAINDDSNFGTTVTNAIANKQDKVTGVSDTEIGYLDGVSSPIQSQIDQKASTGKAIAMSIVFGG